MQEIKCENDSMLTEYLEVWNEGKLRMKNRNRKVFSFINICRFSWNCSARNYWRVVFTHAIKSVTMNVHRARKKANRNVYVEAKRWNVTAIVWYGIVTNCAISYLNVDCIDAKRNATVETAAIAQMGYWGHALAVKKWVFKVQRYEWNWIHGWPVVFCTF